MTERQIQKKIIDRYEALGWYVIKLIKTNKNGIPDLICLKENEKPLFIEVKTEKGVLSKLQEYRIKELTEKSFDVKILRK